MQPNGADDSYPDDEDFSDGPGPMAEGDPLDHLWNAAHEMLGALRGLLEAADEFVESQRARPARRADEPRESRVHHIDIDVRADGSASSEAAPSDSNTEAS